MRTRIVKGWLTRQPEPHEYGREISYLDRGPRGHQAFDGGRQVPEMTDQPVGLELGDRYLGIAEFDPDHGNTGAARHPDIRTGIADHDRGGYLAARPRDGLPQDRGIGLGNAKGVGAANRGKSRAQSQLVEQQLRQPFELVGADREAIAPPGQIIERAFQALERA